MAEETPVATAPPPQPQQGFGLIRLSSGTFAVLGGRKFSISLAALVAVVWLGFVERVPWKDVVSAIEWIVTTCVAGIAFEDGAGRLRGDR